MDPCWHEAVQPDRSTAGLPANRRRVAGETATVPARLELSDERSALAWHGPWWCKRLSHSSRQRPFEGSMPPTKDGLPPVTRVAPWNVGRGGRAFHRNI